jgi:hypothetical protein
MPEIHVLVIFCCDTGAVERLALAAAVGAVQGRASIRLRRIVDPAGAENDATERMDRDFIAPRTADLHWAHGVVLALPDHLLSQLHTLGGLSGKRGVSLVDCKPDGLQGLGLSVDILGKTDMDRNQCMLVGRRLAETLRAGN